MTQNTVTVRLPDDLYGHLHRYARDAHITKTEVVLAALSQYLGVERVLLSTRVAQLERRVQRLESKL
ncbi:hypothetical protein [Lyngbya sp. CCY1209]|uniref:hypothetical protein n=1 Tax=Lyngbya sp. CCY1209 TaxID=2886103 RepID=UPI002D203DE0|nr:hypothetical protein [Lyngbya sp. CCY1209]MEB3886132.1 hypothetical protein [Lyngbya sp. CCY1209]